MAEYELTYLNGVNSTWRRLDGTHKSFTEAYDEAQYHLARYPEHEAVKITTDGGTTLVRELYPHMVETLDVGLEDQG